MFPLPPYSDLQHPCLEWTIDKAEMDSYMPACCKQEGFPATHVKGHGGVFRWRSIHGEEHNNYHGLPAEVTAKNWRQAQAGTFSGIS